jgi:adenylate cyclase
MVFVYELEGKREQMVSAALRAIELNPSHVRAYGRLATALALAGRADEGIEYAERARRLDPKGAGVEPLDALTWAHFAAGRYEEAAEWAQRTIDRHPNYEVGYRGLAASYAQLGRIEEANAAVQQQLRLVPSLTIAVVRSHNAATDPDFLERWLDGLRKAGLPEG